MKSKHNTTYPFLYNLITMDRNTVLDCTLYGNPFDNIIANYLNMRDIFNLKSVNRRFYYKLDNKYIFKTIKSRIENKLKKVFRNNYNSFVSHMIKSRAVLSGSFILQVLINETWDNSDIDIYTGTRRDNKIMHEYFESITGRESMYNYGEMYKVAYDIISSIDNYYLNKKNTIDSSEDDNDNPYDEYNKRAKEKAKLEKNCYKIQLVDIKTKKNYTLLDHVKNTGFDVCKNMLYYDTNGKMQIQLMNYKEIIHKCTTFTIQNIDDFYYRIEKYSKRGYYFKPKYNKLLYVEYLYLCFTSYHKHTITTDFDEDHYYKGSLGCGVNCPIKLLYRDIRHYHLTNNKEQYHSYAKKTTVVDDKYGIFSKLLPQLKNRGIDRESLQSAIYKCKDIDSYARIRNKFAEHKININDTRHCKYDIQFGLPNIIPKQIKKKTKPKKAEPDKNGWITVQKRK